MSAFSRGAFLWSGCAAKACSQAFLPCEAIRSQFNGFQRAAVLQNNFIKPRDFTSSAFLQASKKIRAAQKLRPPTPPNPNKTFGKFPHPASPPPQRVAIKHSSPNPKPIAQSRVLQPTSGNIITITQPPTASTSTYTTYADTLCQKTSPTSLYEAPNQTPFILACTTLSVLAFASGAYLYWGMVLSPPPGLAGWVSIPYIITSFSLFGIATWIGIKPINLIKSISAVPQRAAKAGERLRIEIRHHSLPFLPQKTLLISPSQVTLPYRISKTSTTAAKLSPVEALSAAQKKRDEAASDQRNLIFLPIRHAYRGFKNGFKSVRSRLNEKGAFTKIEVGNRKLKLDTKGWILDKGKSLDRLFNIKP